MNDTSKKTFQEIINQYKIEIPIIQRDYAQGRNDDKIQEIRGIFLDAIFDKLQKNECLHLDFVYGSVEKNKFIPLDGQQRLTTLFLLYWYFKKKESQNIDLKNFTYVTRASSREFCQNLVQEETKIDFSKGKLSEQIKDSAWFLTFWEKDPTVQSMLTMIDAIYNKFQSIENGFERLNNISFEFLQMEHFGLTDDLYIKMNARGKELTKFENFKAKFQQHIENENFEDDVQEIEKFSHKIDTVWLDLFWKHRKEDNSVDDKFMNFISRIAIQAVCLFPDKKTEEKEEIGKETKEKIQKIYGNNVELNDFTNQGSFNYLKQCFDLYSDKSTQYDKLEIGITLWNKNGKKTNLFKNSLLEKTSYQEQVLFFAQTQYLLNHKEANKNVSSEESFKDWMRVIRNIVHNSTIDSPSTFKGATKLIQELLAGSDDIYKYLAGSQINSKFASRQIQQEILKAKLIMKDEKNKQVIFDTEDTNFCKGNIEFALYCIDFNETNLDSFCKGKLSQIKAVIQEYLSKNDVTNKFRAALFTVNPNFYTYWRSWLFAADCPKYCLIKDINDLKHNTTYSPSLKDDVKTLLNQLIGNKGIKQLLTEFTPLDMPTWKKKIIENPNILDFSKKHYIAVPHNQSHCYLIPQSRVSRKDGLAKCKELR